MGLSGYDQTACLAEAQGFAAEEHSHNRCNRRILSKEAKIPIRTNNTENAQIIKVKEKPRNLHRMQTMI